MRLKLSSAPLIQGVIYSPRGHSNILVYTCVNLGFNNTPKQVLTISKKTPQTV